MVYNAWSTAIKLSWSCPRWTRTFLVQKVLECGETSAKTDILGRYARFSAGLRHSTSREVRVLFGIVSRDLRTITAKNLKLVADLSGCDPWTASPAKLKQELHKNLQVAIPDQDSWKVRYLSSLLSQLMEAKHLAMEERTAQLQSLIDSLVR